MGLVSFVAVEGKVDMVKTYAAVAHFLFACAFLKFQVLTPDASFDVTLWATYGAFAISHDAYNRATAMLKDVKDKQIEANSAAALPASST
jgi:hypothetical protein